MQLALDILVLLTLSAISLRGVVRARREHRVNSADLICTIVFGFYGLPLLYDRLFPSTPPDWFYRSATSHHVRAIYTLVVLLSVILIKLGAYRRQRVRTSDGWQQGLALVPMRPNSAIALLTFPAWLLLLLPLPVVLLTGTGALFLSYGRVVQFRHTLVNPSFISMVHIICIAAMMGFFLIYWVRTRQTRSALDPVRWLAVSLAIVTVYIYGKRSLVFALVIIISFVKFLESRLKVRTLVIFGFILSVGSYLYVGYAKELERSPLAFIRGDLARDYTLRHTIYRSGWTASNLVPYRGATYVFFATAYVPRVYWPAKPWPAPVYLTTDVFGQIDYRQLGWGFGLGFMEELIMNFGYLGILGCLLIGKLCAWLDGFIYSRSSYYAILWVPLIFGCVFASSVILKLIVFIIVPALLLSPIFARRGAWTPVLPGRYDPLAVNASRASPAMGGERR